MSPTLKKITVSVVGIVTASVILGGIALGTRVSVVETKQSDMVSDIQDMKRDIKEILRRLP